MLQIFSRQGAPEIMVASMARWKKHLRLLIVLEREGLDFSEAIEHLSEKQELLATLMESKMSLQKVAPEEFQRQIFQELKELEDRRQKKHWSSWDASTSWGIRKMNVSEQGCYKGWSCQRPKVVFQGPVAVPLLILAHLP